MTRVFLDANVLFSAAYTEKNGFAKLWGMKKIRLLTSTYALKEAERNLALKRPEAAARLAGYAGKMEIVPAGRTLDNDYGLPEKDLPILAAAAGAGCTALLTGDIADFGHLLGKTVEGIKVMTVRMFLAP